MKNNYINKSQDGFMLISVIVLMALTLLVAAGMVSSKATEARIRTTTNDQVHNYAKVEDSMSKTVAWLQANSNNIVGAFNSTNFGTNFDITSPSVGANESANFSVPTLIKMKGTTNSVMLSNNSLFGTSAFPATTNISTGVAFDAVSAFASANLGDANTRIVLVWARNTAGHYQPVFRVDTITDNSPDRGVHSFTYIYSTLVTGGTPTPFFTSPGEIQLDTGNNKCASYQYTYSAGTWTRGAVRANCALVSNSNIHTKANVSGSIYSKENVEVQGGATVSGTVCHNNNTCHSLVMPTIASWTTTCGSTNRGNLTVSADTILTAASDNPADNCWGDVTINSNRTLTLSTTDHAYHFKRLSFQNNSNSKLAFASLAESEDIELYVQDFNGPINGNQWINSNNAPHQIKLYITGSGTTQFNGTAVVNANIVSPNMNIEFQGNFNFYGGIWAKQIALQGNSTLNADESISGSSAIIGLNFAQTKASQRYRLF